MRLLLGERTRCAYALALCMSMLWICLQILRRLGRSSRSWGGGKGMPYSSSNFWYCYPCTFANLEMFSLLIAWCEHWFCCWFWEGGFGGRRGGSIEWYTKEQTNKCTIFKRATVMLQVKPKDMESCVKLLNAICIKSYQSCCWIEGPFENEM